MATAEGHNGLACVGDFFMGGTSLPHAATLADVPSSCPTPQRSAPQARKHIRRWAKSASQEVGFDLEADLPVRLGSDAPTGNTEARSGEKAAMGAALRKGSWRVTFAAEADELVEFVVEEPEAEAGANGDEKPGMGTVCHATRKVSFSAERNQLVEFVVEEPEAEMWAIGDGEAAPASLLSVPPKAARAPPQDTKGDREAGFAFERGMLLQFVVEEPEAEAEFASDNKVVADALRKPQPPAAAATAAQEARALPVVEMPSAAAPSRPAPLAAQVQQPPMWVLAGAGGLVAINVVLLAAALALAARPRS